MNRLSEIRQEIEQLTERRAELLRELSGGHDVLLAAEHKQVEEEIQRLWEEHRIARAQARWGDRETIIHRARQEERLERAA